MVYLVIVLGFIGFSLYSTYKSSQTSQINDFSLVFAILFIALGLVLVAIYRKSEGLRQVNKGRKFGNEIADSMGINRGLFHTAIEEGGFPMHLIHLSLMKEGGVLLKDARKEMLPFLAIGMNQLEQRFGSQKKIIEAKVKVGPYLADVMPQEENDTVSSIEAGWAPDGVREDTWKKLVRVRGLVVKSGYALKDALKEIGLGSSTYYKNMAKSSVQKELSKHRLN